MKEQFHDISLARISLEDTVISHFCQNSSTGASGWICYGTSQKQPGPKHLCCIKSCSSRQHPANVATFALGRCGQASFHRFWDKVQIWIMRQKESSLLMEIASCVCCDLDATPGSIIILDMVSFSCFPIFLQWWNCIRTLGKNLNVLTVIKTRAS